MLFDSLQIGVEDLAAGLRQYRLLLGCEGTAGAGLYRFAFERGAVELVPGELGMRSLRFAPEADERPAWPSGPHGYHGICVLTDARADAGSPTAAGPDRPHAVDHVVIQSPDLDRAVALWRDRLGVRLALDREFPQRGLRLLFFRSAGVTLEFSGAMRPAAATIEDRGGDPDLLWGIAYQVADLAACRERLLSSGVEVSDIRGGQKKGTVVATVKSHDLGVPTLLIQPAARV